MPSVAVKLNAAANIHQNLPITIHFGAFRKRIPHNTEALWKDVSSLVSKDGGYLIIDDSTLDKTHARSMHLIGIHSRGNITR